LKFVREQSVPVIYKCLKLDCGYRVDMVVEGTVLLEIKSVEAILPVHEAQLLTYLRLGGWKAGLLMNFNVPVLTEGGIRRKVFGLEE
jgi:GxxExxY protein